MEAIPKSYLAIFFLILITLVGAGLLVSGVDARNADAFLADCTNRIEASNYSSGVIAACEADAKEVGYELEVERYTAADSHRVSYGHMVLHYKFKIPLLGMENDRYVEADLH